jgi:YfiH family protein
MLRSRLLHDVPHAFTDAAFGDLRPSAEGFPARARALVDAIGARGPLVSVTQVHGARVVMAEDVTPATEADAIVTTTPGTAIAVRVADCVPILLVAPGSQHGPAGAVASVHAGWRGTAAGIARHALARLCDAAGVRPTVIRAAIGPTICLDCYEVDAEVLEGLEGILPAGVRTEVWRRDTRPGHACVDVGAVNAAILREAGVEVDHLRACTRCARGDAGPLYWSHRRDPAQAGRQVGVVALPQPHPHQLPRYVE